GRAPSRARVGGGRARRDGLHAARRPRPAPRVVAAPARRGGSTRLRGRGARGARRPGMTALAMLDTGRRLAWLAPPLAVLVVVGVALPRRRTPMIPLADGASYDVPARRTASVRVMLATLLVVLLALGVALLARNGAPVARAAPPHTGTIL